VCSSDLIDVTAFMGWFIENYPRSFAEKKKHPECNVFSLQGSSIYNRRGTRTGGIDLLVNYTNRDFTLDKYKDLCCTLQTNSITPLTVRDYLKEEYTGHPDIRKKTIILRHDVDRKIMNALRMARLEHEMGIHSTYYFRYPYTFKPDIIREIQGLGHEIGYHYEVFAKAKGDPKKAIRLFEQELGAMREICDVKTICMHGSPLSQYDNRDLWKRYDFRDFGIDGEAYLSLQNAGLWYFTDTGRSWNGKHSGRDVMLGSNASLPPLETTIDLINWIGSSGDGDLYLAVHPERWAMSEGEWVIGYIQDLCMNIVKSGIRVLIGSAT
jgi:hypothetical protein